MFPKLIIRRYVHYLNIFDVKRMFKKIYKKYLVIKQFYFLCMCECFTNYFIRSRVNVTRQAEAIFSVWQRYFVNRFVRGLPLRGYATAQVQRHGVNRARPWWCVCTSVRAFRPIERSVTNFYQNFVFYLFYYFYNFSFYFYNFNFFLTLMNSIDTRARVDMRLFRVCFLSEVLENLTSLKLIKSAIWKSHHSISQVLKRTSKECRLKNDVRKMQTLWKPVWRTSAKVENCLPEFRISVRVRYIEIAYIRNSKILRN